VAEQKNDQTKKEMTAAEAAKLVVREVPVLDKETGQPTGKTRQVPVKPSDVFAYRDYGDHVVVVTKDGHKFRGEKN